MIDPADIKKRRGRFLLSADRLNDNLPFIQKIMSQVIVMRCEYLWGINVFDYEAISPLFDQCPENEQAPDYMFSEDELLDLKCQKIKDRFETLTKGVRGAEYK